MSNKIIHTEHIRRIDRVNQSLTVDDHRMRERALNAWRQGVEDAGGKIDYMAADLHYLDQGIDRPMCCGVWLDWEECI